MTRSSYLAAKIYIYLLFPQILVIINQPSLVFLKGCLTFTNLYVALISCIIAPSLPSLVNFDHDIRSLVYCWSTQLDIPFGTRGLPL